MIYIVFALCALVCAAVNDFIFKLFALKERSRGIFFSLIGIVWLGFSFFIPYDFSNWKTFLLWGVLSGFFSITANILLIESMALQSAGVCSTIYRLNLVPVALIATFAFHESLSMINWFGIAAAAGAVICFMPKNEENARSAKLGILLVVIGSLLRAGQGLTAKQAMLCDIGAGNAVSMITAVWWIIGGVCYAFWRERSKIRMDGGMYGFGVASGAAVLGIMFFMLKSLEGGDAAIVLPIQQISFPMTLIFSAVFLKEKITLRKIGGVLLAIAAVLLLCCKGG